MKMQNEHALLNLTIRLRAREFYAVIVDEGEARMNIEHSLLFKKLHSLGVSRKAVDWFKSYLSDRSQFVRIGHILSEGRVITHGIPQGSILGPALFSIYINDLPTTPVACPLKSYVDDSKIYLSFSFKDINVAEIQLTDDLRRIAAWCCSNSLLANPEKTKLLLFGTPQMLNHVQNFRVTFLDKDLQPVTSARDLGVEFDGCLSYDEHITQVVSKYVYEKYCKTTDRAEFCCTNCNWHEKVRSYHTRATTTKVVTCFLYVAI